MIFRFCKRGPAKYTSHLDVQSALHRWLSRARIPIRFSAGFNPHPVLAFAGALSLGVESEGEYADIGLEKDMGAGEFLERMNKSAPPGMNITGCWKAEEEMASLMSLSRWAIYRISFDHSDAGKLAAAAQRILQSPEFTATRRTKSGERMENIRPLIGELKMEDGAIMARLASSSQGSLSPQALLEAVCREAGTEAPRCTTILKADTLFAKGPDAVTMGALLGQE
jgi:radical SAM-linked protein